MTKPNKHPFNTWAVKREIIRLRKEEKRLEDEMYELKYRGDEVREKKDFLEKGISGFCMWCAERTNNNPPLCSDECKEGYEAQMKFGNCRWDEGGFCPGNCSKEKVAHYGCGG